jgi:N-acetylglucosamine-6-phosphate deacetylase
MASTEQIKKAIAAGLKAATHLFNAMAPLRHRSPGIIGEVLNSPGFYYSIIADGMHVDPQAVAIAWKCQPEGLFLISDGIAALGCPDGIYSLGGRQVEVSEKGAYVASTSVLAGSTVGMDQQLRNFIRFTSASLVDAVEAASLKPAKILGLYPQKGCLNPGSDADFVLLDGDLQVLASYVKGKEIYKRD